MAYPFDFPFQASGTVAPMTSIAKSVAVATGKGGVGKTLIACSLGGLWARVGQRVLVVDIDAQASATRTLGITPEKVGRGRGLFDTVVRGEPLRWEASPGREGLGVVPAGLDTREIETALVATPDAEERFAAAFAGSADRWDRIIFDLPPAVAGKRLSEVVLSCSEALIAPCTGSHDDIDGLVVLTDMLELLQARTVLIGVALVRMPAASTRRRAQTVERINRMLDGATTCFDAVVRTAEHAYNNARDQSLLPHEYAEWLQTPEAQIPTGERIRAGIPAPPKNAGALADDLRGLAAEASARLSLLDDWIARLRDDPTY